MRKYAIIVVAIIIVLFLGLTVVLASPPREQTVKAKFYDFSEQLIDGEINKPTALYTDSRQEAKFKRGNDKVSKIASKLLFRRN